jgi:N-acetylmuramoyl-L-alanine amidase/type II secretory pathway predicted ATPase ExeA
MFLEFYGLKEQPFGVTPDPHFICATRTHSKAFISLSRGLEAGCGFLALIAKPGMGKTTLVFQLLEQLEQTSRTVFLFQTQCNSRELLRYLLSGLGLDAAGQDIVGMHESLNQILARELLAGRRFVLVIDECQNLDHSVLETVRLLSDFETAKTKLIQIVLVGQTELAEKLSSPSLAQLRQRISMLCRLEPLTQEEIVRYIEHRLQVAGYAGTPLFTAGALERILTYSEGIPRNINKLCFSALLAGCTVGSKQIDSAIVDQVLTDLDMNAVRPAHSAAEEGPAELVRRASLPPVDPTPAGCHDAGKVVGEFEVARREFVPQVAQPEVPPPTPRSPLSSAGVPRGDLSDRKQVDLRSGSSRPGSTENSDLPQRLSAVSGVPRFSHQESSRSKRRFKNDVSLFSDILEYVDQTAGAVQLPKVISDSDPNTPPRKPVADALAPAVLRRREQSDRDAAPTGSSLGRQVASTRMDGVVADPATICPAREMAQGERMAIPAPPPTVLSYPVASRWSLRRWVEGALALVTALALVGPLSFYSQVGGSRHLEDPAAGSVVPPVMPLPTPQGSRALGLAPHSPSAATPRRAFGQSFLTRTLGLKVGRIVIDAGHGGYDTGTIGPMGLIEKDLCLDVALRLGRIIKQRLPGAEVIFTRTDDTFIPLRERTGLANEKKADLFLSIHANSSRSPVDRGVETYYLSLRGGRGAMEVAARENAPVQETEADLQELVKEIARSEKIEESRKFAEDIQDSLSRQIQGTAQTVRSRGVRRAPFVVLVGANMPSVLAEISFLSNPSDEQLLEKDEYRQRLAEGLYQGVESYLQGLNSVPYDLPARNPTTSRSSLGAFSTGPAVEPSRNQH